MKCFITVIIIFLTHILCFIFIISGFCQDFGYEGQEGPVHWGEKYEHCVGKHQSPINILVHNVHMVHLTPMIFKNFHLPIDEAILTNNGHTVVVTFQMQHPLIVSGGPLIGDYEFTQLHFHWGANNGEGSENTINNSSYPLEAHAVFYQKAYGSPQEAVDHPDGLAVLSFLYQVSDRNNENYGRIVNVLPNVKEPNTNATIYNFPELQKLIVKDTSVYYVYGGSLTTPPCNEAVTWIEFTDTVPIAPNQIDIFRQLNGEYGKLNHNFRPVQPLHGRIIRMNRGLDHISIAMQHSYSWCTIIINMFILKF
ncbi:hypothetical protein RI129_000868 [Pyrocoelia pectoralis]|uniref:Carbonic anhydrase n=1 Tax=Pyrocoelia pectoralis TaxID=417401 RepID=A0AAN7VSN7_9COLE